MASIYQFLPELQGRELILIQSLTSDFSETQMQNFANIYRVRRRDPQMILLTTLLGFVVVAGVQRFLVGQIGMGILYLFTAGLCFIGTIVDLINYQDLAYEYNQRIANEVAEIAKDIR
ncbi:MAG: TM2 domain-containing protein [Bacteroidales bacterium]